MDNIEDNNNIVNLSIIPEGWYLVRLCDEREPIKNRNDIAEHINFTAEIQFQYGGGRAKLACGDTPMKAILKATEMINELDIAATKQYLKTKTNKWMYINNISDEDIVSIAAQHADKKVIFIHNDQTKCAGSIKVNISNISTQTPNIISKEILFYDVFTGIEFNYMCINKFMIME